MRLHDYTYNTGHHDLHETDTIAAPEVIMACQSMLVAGRGVVAGCADGSLTYLWTEVPDLDMAITSTYVRTPDGPAPIWISIAYSSGSGGREALDQLRAVAGDLGITTKLQKYRDLQAPGLVTLLLPSGYLAGMENIKMLADYAKCMAAAWIEGKV